MHLDLLQKIFLIGFCVQGSHARLLDRHLRAKYHQKPTLANLAPRRTTSQTYYHQNDGVAKFRVNGTNIPQVPFDIGESYAGLLPISSDADETRQLYFWYFPSPNPSAKDEITIWLNGGPGASSLEGLLQENGPFQWQFGTFEPVPNPWTWVNLTNVIWVDQPVGTGFSTGNASAVSEEDVAQQFLGFWKNFVDTFELQQRKVYLTGESYAGMFIPYIADAMFTRNDTAYFNVEATLMFDPLINSNAVMRQIPAFAFAKEWKDLIGLNTTFMKDIEKRAADCGYTDFLGEYLEFPPKQRLPSPPVGQMNDEGDTVGYCDIWGSIVDASLLVNPCFDVYQIATTCPLLYDPLGFPGTMQYLQHGASIYFDSPAVKRAINAPQIPWSSASPRKIYNTTLGLSTNDSNGEFTGLKVLPRVIEKSKRTLIGHSELGYILLKAGTLLTIQNMTWNGMQGFQQPIEDDFYVPYHDDYELGALAGAGIVGKARTERGLTFFSVTGAGHMVSQYAPSAAYRSVQMLLGRIDSLSDTTMFEKTSDGLSPLPPAPQYTAA